MNSFYNKHELDQIGFKRVGTNVLISSKCSIYSPELMSIGNNVRIDDFCILSGEITLGNQIHIGAYCGLYGAKKIIMHDYTGLSPRCTVFSAVDDFMGDYLISPMAPKEFTNVTGGSVIFNQYSQIGACTVLLPNITIGEGTVVGAMSLVNNSLNEWSIYAGIPALKIKDRKKGLLKYV